MEQIFVGRQAIYDRKSDLFGYELLYRHSEENHASFSDGQQASSHVILSTFLDIGFERLVGSHRAFINLTHAFLDGEITLPVSPNQIVLEVLESVEPTPETLAGLHRLRAQGYTIALDDFVLTNRSKPLLEVAHIVKLDTQVYSREELRHAVESLRDYPIKLLAEKVETAEMFDYCNNLGFDYFQGFFLCHPQVISGKALPNNQMVILQLLAKLQEPEVGIGELKDLITMDAALSFQLLRYINCASFALRREIGSIHEAIMLLGLDTIRQWATLLRMKQLHQEQPRELLALGLQRAHMCECLARAKQCLSPQQAFTVGLFSILEAMLGKPLDELLDEIPLAMSIKLALLEEDGPLGQLLKQSISFEQGEWQALDTVHCPQPQLQGCYLEAIKLSDEQIATLYR